MKFKKIVGIIQLVGGIALSLITFLAWKIVKRGLRIVEGAMEPAIVEVSPLLIREVIPLILLFIFIITLIISLLLMLQGVVNIKE